MRSGDLSELLCVLADFICDKVNHFGRSFNLVSLGSWGSAAFIGFGPYFVRPDLKFYK